MVDILRVRKTEEEQKRSGKTPEMTIAADLHTPVPVSALRMGQAFAREHPAAEAPPASAVHDPGFSGMSFEFNDEQARTDMLVFKLGEQLFAVEIMHVLEVVRLTDITRVPNAPAFVLGVINLRGTITPILDLHTRFGLGQVQRTEKCRIIVVQIRSQPVGFLVDSVSKIIHAPDCDIDTRAGSQTTIASDHVRAMVKLNNVEGQQGSDQLLILLNLEHVLEERSILSN